MAIVTEDLFLFLFDFNSFKLKFKQPYVASNYCIEQYISKHSKKMTKVISLDEKARLSYMLAMRDILYI